MDFKNLKWLHDMGFALHWLYPKSKMPIGSTWQQGPRKTWKEFIDSYADGNNVGVRTGQPSQFKDGSYLVILDIDVKSSDPQDAKAAYSAAENFLGRKLKGLPQVASGRGGHSLHIYARCKSPKSSFNLIRSPKHVQVLMPSIRPGKKETEQLTKEQIQKGIRIRPAFEIDVLGTGKQAAIPPSIHPDSGKEYKWKTPIAEIKDVPIVSEDKFKNVNKTESRPIEGIEFKEVDLASLGLSNKAVSLIEAMDGLEAYGGDRSAALFGVVAEMVLKNIEDSDILSVLSDPLNAISEVVIDRVGNDFHKCAAWILPQIQKMRHGKSPEEKFKDTEDFLIDAEWGLEGVGTPEVAKEMETWRTDLDKNQQGGTKLNLKNVSLYLRNVCSINEWLGHNLFTGEIEFLKAPPWNKKKKDIDYKHQMLSDADVVEARLYLSRKEKFEPTGHLMLESMISCAQNNSFHPVRDWINSLEWDGIERVDSWLHNYMGAAPSEYSKAVGRKLLIAAITRIMKPGCKFDHVVIMEGLQGIGKSTALRILSEPWFCDSLGDVTNKDVIQQMQGSWFIEIGELASLDRASMNAFKDFVTKQEDKARLAYQRLAKKFPRQCVFIGTTNDDEYLKDTTGNRRFWPVEIEVSGKIEHEALAMDKEMIWAEALQIYKKGDESLWLDNNKTKDLHEQITASKMVSDPWDNLIENWVKCTKIKQQKNSDSGDTLRVETQEIWSELFGRSAGSITKWDQMRIAGSLKRIGFNRLKTNSQIIWMRFLKESDTKGVTNGHLQNA